MSSTRSPPTASTAPRTSPTRRAHSCWQDAGRSSTRGCSTSSSTPSTTCSRSDGRRRMTCASSQRSSAGHGLSQLDLGLEHLAHLGDERLGRERLRSEEHTSELQSRLHLVCRLLLEKKNK